MSAPEISTAVRDIVFRVRRYNPETDEKPYYQDFTVPVPEGMVVLEGLWSRRTWTPAWPGAPRAGWACAAHAACW